MIKHCVICGKAFNNDRNYKTCSPECRRKLNRRLTLQWLHDKRQQISDSATCSICGKTFKPNFPNEHFCSDDCRFDSPLYRFLSRQYGNAGIELF
ncbi:MAG: DUF2116 family Zn-ribbon domain-containing protein [Clostridia bacterium]|nr:DUF2116 family Zn-ribbon domain-containing protein [Clostridia bacterium]MBR6713168.1 DUF2116 family Zn-ribbon domain-containing protein [Selenomonadaceae bacterium]